MSTVIRTLVEVIGDWLASIVDWIDRLDGMESTNFDLSDEAIRKVQMPSEREGGAYSREEELDVLRQIAGFGYDVRYDSTYEQAGLVEIDDRGMMTLTDKGKIRMANLKEEKAWGDAISSYCDFVEAEDRWNELPEQCPGCNAPLRGAPRLHVLMGTTAHCYYCGGTLDLCDDGWAWWPTDMTAEQIEAIMEERNHSRPGDGYKWRRVMQVGTQENDYAAWYAGGASG
jgi:hypothetical protein